jgi:hypothetical protein
MDNSGPNEAPWQVTDTSGTGNLQTSWYLDPTDSGPSFEVIAIGQTSGAVATENFTDAATHVNSVGVSGVTSGATYGVGAAYKITIAFSGTETVTGTPRIQLNTSPTAYATYTSGSGTSTLTFNYTVAAGNISSRLDYFSTAALQTNGGTIRNAGTNATLTLPALQSANDGVYASNNPIDGGPAVSSLTATPSPTKSVAPTINAKVTDSFSYNITGAEYWVDNASGAPGTGTALSITGSGTSVTVSGTLSASVFNGLGYGSHTIYVDAQDSFASTNWGAKVSQTFIKDTQGPAVISPTVTPSPTNSAPSISATVADTYSPVAAAEYFIDTAGAAGTGTALTIIGSGTTVSVSGTIPSAVFAGLSQGTHTVYVDGEDNLGNWGPQTSTTFVVDTHGPTVTTVGVTPSPTNVAPSISASISDSYDSIANAEYFVDTAGTAGTGTALTVSGTTATGTLANFSSLSDGPHTLYVDAKDAAGNWGSTNSQSFIKDSQIPTVTVTGPTSPTNQLPVNFTATFSVPVTGLTASGITVTGGSVASITGGPSVYTIAVTPSQNPSPQTGEPISLQINAGAAQSANTNYNGVHDASQASNIVSLTFDNVPPALTGMTLTLTYPTSLPAGYSLDDQATFYLTLTYNENVIATNAVLHLNAATQSSMSGSGTQTLTFYYSVPLDQLTNTLDFVNTNMLTGTLTDAAGNNAGLPTAGPGGQLNAYGLSVDSIPPVVTITPLTSASAPFTFQLSSSQPIGPLNGSGSNWFNGTYLSTSITNITLTSPTTLTFQISPPTGGNTVSIGGVAGNIFWGGYPETAYDSNPYTNTAAAITGTVLPSVAVTSAPGGNFNAPITLAGTYSDNGGTSITQVQVAITSVASAYPTNVYTATFSGGTWSYTIPANTFSAGSYVVYAKITNSAGDIVASGPTSTFAVIDNAPPVTTSSTYYKSGTKYYSVSPQANGWFNYQYTSGGIYFLLSATDANTGNSGIAATYYTIDGGSPQTYTSAAHIQVAGNGQHTVTYWSVDGAGNIETAHSLPIWIDNVVPTVMVNQPANGVYDAPMTITGTWTAGLSGVNVGLAVYDFTDHYSYITIMEQGSGHTAITGGTPATVNPNGTWSFTFTPTGAVWGSSIQIPVELSNWMASVSVASLAGQGGTGAMTNYGGNGLYTSAPSVTLTGGGGSGATAHAIEQSINGGGFVTSVVIDNGGSGYTSPPTVTFGYAGAGNASGTAVISNGQVIAVNMTPFSIGKATPTINWNTPADITYGTPLSGTQLDAAAVYGSNATVAGTFTYTPAAGKVLNAGPHQALMVSFTPTDTTDYTTASDTVYINVNKANPTITVTPYNVPYDSNSHMATGSATGVLGENLLTKGDTLDLSGTMHTNAGTYTDSWTFTDTTGNYNNASGTVTDVISKANANITVTPYNVPYDSYSHTATGSVTGVGSDGALSGLDLSGTTHTHAGTYTDTWTFTDSTGNYNNASGTVTDIISKANANITVTPYNVPYDSYSHTATGSVTGVGSDGALSGLDLSGTTHTHAGSYSDGWTFTDVTGNYNNASGTVTDVISKANANITVTPYSVVYDGNAHTATGSVTGVGSDGGLSGLDLSGTTHTQAGTYTDTWTFTDATGNYNNATGTVSDSIGQAPLTITANNDSKFFGTLKTFSSTAFTPSGLVPGTGDTITGVTETSTGAPPPAPMGSYPIVPSAAVGTGLSNYKITYLNGTLTVAPSVIVLDPTANGALSLAGTAKLGIAGAVFVDSSSATALSANGNNQINASLIDVTGNVYQFAHATISPAPVTGAPALADPLAGLPAPSTSGLTNYTNQNDGDTDEDDGIVNISSRRLGDHVTRVLSPGMYNQIQVTGNATLMLLPGIYDIAGLGLYVSDSANLVMAPATTPGYTLDPITGSGVLIYNTGTLRGSTMVYGSITLNSTGSINLQAATSGPYAGVLIYQDPLNGRALSINSAANAGMTGIVYAPAALLVMDTASSLNGALVVKQLNLSGSGNVAQLVGGSNGVAYGPAQIAAAYGLQALNAGRSTPLDGTGQTIAIVDAYDDPNIYQAVDAFDSQMGLTTSGPTLYDQYGPATSFLTVLGQDGLTTSLPGTDPAGAGTDNWEVETALDVEWAHAMAPGAQIILVEANSQALTDLMAGVTTAACQPGVSVVSISWGYAEGIGVLAADEAAYDGSFTTPGVTFVASTGDYGAAAPVYPAFSPNVLAVGGTSLLLNGDNTYQSETGWGYSSSSLGMFIGSGGGISQYETEPAYQGGVQSTGYRTTPDVSFVADPATGAWIADPYNNPSNPWEVVGGTSLSAPCWSGLIALVNQGRVAAGQATLNSTSPTQTQQALYSLSQTDYNVISSGSNGYNAGAGYNLVTGLGTPIANLLVSDLIAGNSAATGRVPAISAADLVNSGASVSNGGVAATVMNVFTALTASSPGLGQTHHRAAESASSLSTTSAPGLATPLTEPSMTVMPATALGSSFKVTIDSSARTGRSGAVGSVSTFNVAGTMNLLVAAGTGTPVSTEVVATSLGVAAMPATGAPDSHFLPAVGNSGGDGPDQLLEARGAWRSLSGDEPAGLLPRTGPLSPEAIGQILDPANETKWMSVAPAADGQVPASSVGSASLIEAIFSQEGVDPQLLRTRQEHVRPAPEAPAVAEPSVAWVGLLAVLLSQEAPPARATDRRPVRAARKP